MSSASRRFAFEHDNHQVFDGIYHDQDVTPDDLAVPGAPIVWIDLAEDAIRAGRLEQAEVLVETAYQCFDLALIDQAIDRLCTAEKEAQFDTEDSAEFY